MEVKINQVVLHLLDPGASEPVLSDRAMDMDADLYEYYTATLERAFASDEVKNCRFCRTPLLPRRWRRIRISSTCPAALRALSF